MKKTLLAISIMLVISGCSTTKSVKDNETAISGDTGKKSANNRFHIQGDTPLLQIIKMEDGHLIESKFKVSHLIFNQDNVEYKVIDRMESLGYYDGYKSTSDDDIGKFTFIFFMVEVTNNSDETRTVKESFFHLYSGERQMSASALQMEPYDFRTHSKLLAGETFLGILYFAVPKDRYTEDLRLKLGDSIIDLDY